MVDESISRKTDQIYEVQLSKNYLNMLFSNNNSKQLIPNSKVPPCWYSEDESDKINVEKRKLNFQELKTSKKIKDDQTKFIEPALKTRRQPFLQIFFLNTIYVGLCFRNHLPANLIVFFSVIANVSL